MYTNDYDDRFPIAERWEDSIRPYTGKLDSIYRCPSLVSDAKSGFGYSYRNQVSGVNFSKMKNPEHQILIADSSDLSWNAHSNGHDFPDPPRHIEPNIVFASGRAKRLESMSREAGEDICKAGRKPFWGDAQPLPRLEFLPP